MKLTAPQLAQIRAVVESHNENLTQRLDRAYRDTLEERHARPEVRKLLTARKKAVAELTRIHNALQRFELEPDGSLNFEFQARVRSAVKREWNANLIIAQVTSASEEEGPKFLKQYGIRF